MIICNDVLRWAEEYEGEAFHALLADPPYELNFMGRDWDRSGIAFDPATWAALAEHLHPGAFIFVFASSRGWHRLAVAIEDAGFIFHPSIMMWGWAFGSGFPKSTRIDTQVDRAAGVTREPCGFASNTKGRLSAIHAESQSLGASWSGKQSLPATDLARAWEGHRYGRQALKPAVEMIICAQKPYAGKPVDSIVSTGAGALWIDGGRIRTEEDTGRPKGPDGTCYGHYEQITTQSHPQGRWPANFVVSHSPGCVLRGVRRARGHKGGELAERSSTENWRFDNHDRVGHTDADGLESVADWECEENCAVRRLGEQSGERPSGGGTKTKAGGAPSYKLSTKHYSSYTCEASSGTAARYFKNADWSLDIAERLDNADPVRYCAKASRRERDAGLDSLPLQTRNRVNPGGLENEPRWAPVEARNPHPTVKPLTLTKWLATLLLPPSEYAPRRLLVPFAGTGSECIGALLAGWEEIVGIELEQATCEIAQARIKWWAGWSEHTGNTKPKELLKLAKKAEKDTKQGRLL